MTVMNRQAQRVVLPKIGPDPFWETVQQHFAGSDPHAWKCLAMLALREDCGWQVDQIGWALGHTKGHVTRCINQVKERLRMKFDSPRNERNRCNPLMDADEADEANHAANPNAPYERVANSELGRNSPPSHRIPMSSPTPYLQVAIRFTPMELLTLPITQLRPAPYNPRVPLRPGDAAWAKLSRSLGEFGLVQPLVWNRRTGHLVAGHQRLEILKQRGDSQVECIVVDLPLEREQALNVALNNKALMSDWQADKLTDLIAQMLSRPDMDATLTGFSDEDLRDIVLQPDPEFAPDEEDDDRDEVQVTLHVPQPDWPDVEAALDDLVAAHATVRLHVRSPPG